MSKNNKLEEDDHRNLLNAKERFNNAQTELASNEANIDLLQQKKKSILINYHSSMNALSQLEGDIIKKYGEIKLDIGTGEYTKHEKLSD